ncbi:MAG: DUF4142 domain-containing protein [Prosthecobacter sp.]
MKSVRIPLVAALFAFAAALNAADTKSSLNASDEKFVKATGESGMAEVKIATLGSQKAERADVKEFANMLINDHTKVNGELNQLAQTKGVELSAIVSADAANTFKDLEQESGAGFDKAFLAQMKDSHEKSISNFEDAEKNAADGEVKAWAGKTLPALRQHLDKIKELQGK